MNNLVNEEFCPINPAGECGKNCSGPLGEPRVIGTKVTLTCSDGYENSTEGMNIISECKENADGSGKWELSDNCRSMWPLRFGYFHV